MVFHERPRRGSNRYALPSIVVKQHMIDRRSAEQGICLVVLETIWVKSSSYIKKCVLDFTFHNFSARMSHDLTSVDVKIASTPVIYIQTY